MTIFTTFKTGARAALIAAVIGASALAAMPAQAASPSFNFQFGINGGGGNYAFGIDNGRQFRRACLSDNEVRRGLSREGFRNVRFLDRRGTNVKLIGEYRRDTYTMNLNRCTGRVSNIDRVRDRPGRPGPGRPGIGLQFNLN